MKNGSVSWAVACALSYFYMVSAWGGYVYIINLIPLHVLGLALFDWPLSLKATLIFFLRILALKPLKFFYLWVNIVIVYIFPTQHSTVLVNYVQ